MNVIHVLEFNFFLSLIFLVMPFVIPENWLVTDAFKERSRLLGYAAWENQYTRDRTAFMTTYRVIFFALGASTLLIVPYLYVCIVEGTWLSYTDQYLPLLGKLIFEGEVNIWKLVLAEQVLASGYLGVGIIWSIAFFAIYARRLGRQYRDLSCAWLKKNGLSTLPNDMDENLKALYKLETIAPVRDSMIYAGNFPLETFDQKRFFVANVLIWPISVLSFLFGDAVLKLAGRVDAVLMRRLEKRWRTHMPEVAADQDMALLYQNKIRAVVLAKPLVK